MVFLPRWSIFGGPDLDHISGTECIVVYKVDSDKGYISSGTIHYPIKGFYCTENNHEKTLSIFRGEFMEYLI